MRALITRPEDDAAPLADALAAKGVEVLVEPLLVIRPLEDAALDLDGVQALLFTSANGVRAFAQRSERRDIRVLTVGDASAAAARAAGFAEVESAGGDVNDLVRLVKSRLEPQNGALFHAAGSVVAGDLAGQLSEAGYELRRVTLYEAKPAEALSAATRAALAERGIDLVLFFSPRTAATFVDLVRKTGDSRVAEGCAAATALCLSPAVAEAAGALSWADIRSAEKPDLPAMLRLVDAALEPVPAPAAEPVPVPTTEELPRMTPPPIPAAPPPRQRGSGRALAAAALVAALIAIAGLVTEPLWRPYLEFAARTPPEPAETGLAGRVEALDARARDLTQRLAALDGVVRQLDTRAAGAGADMADLAQRLEATEQEAAALRRDLEAVLNRPAAPAGTTAAPAIPDDIAQLPQQVAALEQQLEAIAQETAAAGQPSAETTAALDELRRQVAAFDDLRGQVEALKTTAASFQAWIGTIESRLEALSALEARVATIERTSTTAETRATGNAALALAVNQLQAALVSQRPFAAELAALSQVAAGDPEVDKLNQAIAPLAGRAEIGVPTVAELRARFPETARAIVAAARAEAAAAAVAETTPATGDPGAEADATPDWLDAALLRLSELVSVRPVGGDVEGDTPAARAARAEALLTTGDLAGAVAELEGLGGNAAEAAAPWLAEARARLDAERALAALQAVAVARLTAAGGG